MVGVSWLVLGLFELLLPKMGIRMPGELIVSTEELRQYNRPMKPETITDWQLYIGILTLGNLPHLILYWTRKKIGTFLQLLALLALLPLKIESLPATTYHTWKTTQPT